MLPDAIKICQKYWNIIIMAAFLSISHEADRYCTMLWYSTAVRVLLSVCRTQRSGWGFLRLVNATNDATTQDPKHHMPVGSPGAKLPSRSSASQLCPGSARIPQLHQSTGLWQKQKAGLRSQTRAERSAENATKPSAWALHHIPVFILRLKNGPIRLFN